MLQLLAGPWWRLVSVLLAASLIASNVCAQTAGADDSTHERAAASARAASTSIAVGGHSAAELEALYLQLAIARAELGASNESRDAFLRLLALDPAFRLPEDVSIEAKSVFMEARGDFSLHPMTLGADLSLIPERSELELSVADPKSLATTVLLSVRRAGGGPYARRELNAQSVQLLAVPEGEGDVEYAITLVDAHRNRLWSLGSEAKPEHLSTGSAKVDVAPLRADVGATLERERKRWPYLLGAGLTLGGGAAALGFGALSSVRRQDEANHWNAGTCTGAGNTRGEICAGEKRRIEQYDRMAIGLYSASGALIVAGVVLLIVAPERRAEKHVDRKPRAWRNLGCGAGPGTLGVSCASTF